MFYFYLARCADGSLYAGSCKSILDRERVHNEGKGAKYTRSRLPVEIIYHERFRSLGKALKREAEVKRWNKVQKEQLCAVA